MLSPYRIPPNSHKRRQKTSNTNLDDDSNHKHDLETPQITSNHLKRLQTASKKPITNKKSKLKGDDPSHAAIVLNKLLLLQ